MDSADLSINYRDIYKCFIFLIIYYLSIVGIVNAFLQAVFRFFINQPNFREGLAVESIWRFIREESGITAAEYGIVLGCIAGVLVIGIIAFYTELGGVFTGWSTWFSGHKTPLSAAP